MTSAPGSWLRRLARAAHCPPAARPWAALGLIGLGSTAGYAIATRWFLYPPMVIGPTALDRMIEYMPWTLPLYLTYFAVLPVFVAMNARQVAFSTMLQRAAAYIGLNIATTIVFPTEIVPWEVMHHHDWGARLLRALDSPYAVLPSGHVGLPCCLALVAYRFGGRGTWVFAGWTVLIAAAVLTTKQHYAWDVPAGIFLACVVAAWPRPRERPIPATRSAR